MSQLSTLTDAEPATHHHGAEWSLVERIASSQSFRKTARLKDLLFYLAETSIRGDYVGLSEQHIGQAVFGKSADYSPVEDSSVRVHIRQLRLKLHEYFDSEGREEPLVVVIPKGGYTLLFRAVPIPEVEAPAQGSPTAYPLVSKGRKRWLTYAPWI